MFHLELNTDYINFSHLYYNKNLQNKQFQLFRQVSSYDGNGGIRTHEPVRAT